MIETARTCLRPLERSDLPLKVKWLSDPVVRETLLLQFPVSLAQTEEWFQRILHDPTRQDFIVILKETSRPVGYAGYASIDWVHRKAEPFIALGEREVWGKGLGTEIVHKLLDYGFNELGFNRQFGFMLASNPGALKMDLRAGFKEEGLLKQDVFLHGRYMDRIMLGITRDEFNAERSKTARPRARKVKSRS